MLIKICKKCNEIKDLSEFNKDKRSKDGHSGYCRRCSNEASKKYYGLHKEEMLISFKKYGKENANKISIQKKVFYRANIDKARAYGRSHKRRYGTGKNTAKKRNISWVLSFDQWLSVVSTEICHYCNGSLPETGCGLDRKDNSIGYLVENVVSCCSPCNEIKSDNLTYREMIEVAKLLKFLRK